MTNEPVSRVVYRSRSALAGSRGVITSQQVQRILSTAQATNESLGITGVLCFDGDSFGQVLEGPTAAVQRIMDSIRRDQRHTDVEVLVEESDVQRAFPDWTMCYVRHRGDTPALVQVSESVDGKDAAWPVSPKQFALISYVRDTFRKALAA